MEGKRWYKTWWWILAIFLSLIWVPILFFTKADFLSSLNRESVSKQTSLVQIAPTPTPTFEPVSEVRGEKSEEFLVTRIIDGDTIEIEDEQKVRYIGLDTPEIVHPKKPVECFGYEAKKKNQELVLGKNVRFEKDVSETDRYGRLLRYVYINEIFVNDYLAREGYAYASTYPPDVKYQEQFRQAQQEARSENRGLWSACASQPESASGATGPTIYSPPPQQPAQTVGCVIKGNISFKTGEKIYHLPGCGSYDSTVISEEKGERFFCSEEEARNAGWRKAKNCP